MVVDVMLLELQRRFNYNRVTGDLTYKVDSGKMRVGAKAGSINAKGYLSVGVNGRPYLAHRLVWLMCTGEYPPAIDHKDGNRTNNAIANLRPATAAENNANRPVMLKSVSGVKGVRVTDRGRFRAEITVQGKRVHLGNYETLEAASLAYSDKASEVYGNFAHKS